MVISVQQCCWAGGDAAAAGDRGFSQATKLHAAGLGAAFASMIIIIELEFFYPSVLEDVFLPYLDSDSGYVPVQKIIIAFILPVTSVFICWRWGLTYWWLCVLCSQCQSEEINLSREEMNIFTVRMFLSCLFATSKFSQLGVNFNFRVVWPFMEKAIQTCPAIF